MFNLKTYLALIVIGSVSFQASAQSYDAQRARIEMLKQTNPAEAARLSAQLNATAPRAPVQQPVQAQRPVAVQPAVTRPTTTATATTTSVNPYLGTAPNAEVARKWDERRKRVTAEALAKFKAGVESDRNEWIAKMERDRQAMQAAQQAQDAASQTSATSTLYRK